MSVIIRLAQREDSSHIWALMRDLAVYEKYIDIFAITPEIVEHSGFDKTPPDFYSLVAVDTDAAPDQQIIGFALYYFLPFTSRNKPALYLKELYVTDGYRGKSVGEKLMHGLYEQAQEHDCARIHWRVASWNKAGMRFYERLGAHHNSDWLNYTWDVAGGR